MVPIYLPAIILAGNTLLKYNKNDTSYKKNQVRRYTIRPTQASEYILPGSRGTVNSFQTFLGSLRSQASKVPPISDSLQRLFKGVSQTVTQITKKTPKEDYEAIVKEYIPIGAGLIKPKYPVNSTLIQFADLDGDSKNELIASYKLNDEINTVILKKRNDVWEKINEIHNPNSAGLNYRGLANLEGSSVKQLLIALSSNGQRSKLYGYNLKNSHIVNMFEKDYDQFEVLNATHNRSTVKPELAVWTKKDSGTYDINSYVWDGMKLAPKVIPNSYYINKVVPYYAGKLKRTPHSPEAWYNLADALVKSKAYRDALIAVEAGMQLDYDSKYKEKFTALRNGIYK